MFFLDCLGVTNICSCFVLLKAEHINQIADPRASAIGEHLRDNITTCVCLVASTELGAKAQVAVSVSRTNAVDAIKLIRPLSDYLEAINDKR